jgi:hypothetical protein
MVVWDWVGIVWVLLHFLGNCQHNNVLPLCRMSCAECRYAECHYAECRYAECRYAACPYAECHYAYCGGASI